MFRNYKIRNLNIKLIISVFVLSLIGIAVVSSANPEYQSKQMQGVVLGIIVMTVVALIDYDFILQFSWLAYIATIGMLLLVLFAGDSSGGAQRWFVIPGINFRFQPSELGKLLLIIFFAMMLMKWEDELNTPKCLVRLAILAGIPLVLILKQPNLSTTIVTFLIIASMIFVTGLNYKIVGVILAIVIPAVILIIVLVLSGHGGFLLGYQGDRILGWLRPEDYPQIAYQQQNSIMAIGSGQIFGKGLNNTDFNSVKNGNFISEPQTDFIFAVAGEELGFVGSIIIVALLCIITVECFLTASKAKDLSGKLLCSGMGAFIGFQSFVNLCVVTGLFPNTGLPLPFVSYGLTSLVTLYLGIGIVLNVGLQAKNRIRRRNI